MKPKNLIKLTTIATSLNCCHWEKYNGIEGAILSKDGVKKHVKMI